MKFLFDLFPVICFVVAYFAAEDRSQAMFVATKVTIIASFVQVAAWWLKTRTFEKSYVVTLVLLVVLGGSTLLLHDKRFIMWKPTAVTWLFAAAFLASQFIGRKTLVERMLHTIDAPAAAWSRANLGAAIFFACLGLINLYVAYNFEEQIWVNFKLFGMFGLTMAFFLGMAFYLLRHAQAGDDAPK